MKLEKEEQIKLMQMIDEILYVYEKKHESPTILLLDVLNWHKLQSLPDIEENKALIDGMRRGKYKGIEVLLVTDPFYGLQNRKPLGNVIMPGSRYV